MSYQLVLTPLAARHLEEWGKSGQKKIVKKILTLLEELKEHPTSGTGRVEQLKGDYSGYWSRRIDKESRLVYAVEDEHVVVTIISMKGHYNKG